MELKVEIFLLRGEKLCCLIFLLSSKFYNTFFLKHVFVETRSGQNKHVFGVLDSQKSPPNIQPLIYESTVIISYFII